VYASRAARFGWYALAELANELRTAGIIPDAQDRDREVADAARIRLSELRACVTAGLATYGPDGSLRLERWVVAGEDRAPRVESRLPLPPKRGAGMSEVQRAQRRAAGLARSAAAGRAGGAFAAGVPMAGAGVADQPADGAVADGAAPERELTA